jgi:hypothetical protein
LVGSFSVATEPLDKEFTTASSKRLFKGESAENINRCGCERLETVKEQAKKEIYPVPGGITGPPCPWGI